MRVPLMLLVLTALGGTARAELFSKFRVIGAERKGDERRVELVVSHEGEPAEVTFCVMPRLAEYGKEIPTLGAQLGKVRVKSGATPLSFHLPAGASWLKPGETYWVGANFVLHDGTRHCWGVASTFRNVDRKTGTSFVMPNSGFRRHGAGPWRGRGVRPF